MKTLTLPLCALVALSIGACDDGTDRAPRPEDAIDRPAGSSQDMLDRIGMTADDTYEPNANGVYSADGDSMMLAGPLVEGRWRERDGGIGFGRQGFGDQLTVRCAGDGEHMLIILPRQLREQDDDAEAAAGENGEDLADPGDPGEARAGSVITENGIATGRFQDIDGERPTRQMEIPAGDPVLAELSEGERFGVAMQAGEILLVPIGPELVAQVEACRG